MTDLKFDIHVPTVRSGLRGFHIKPLKMGAIQGLVGTSKLIYFEFQLTRPGA